MFPYSTLSLVGLDTRTCVSLRDIWVVFCGPVYLAVACSTLSVPEEYSFAVCLGDDFRICHIQRFLVQQWIHLIDSLRNFTYFYVKVNSACSPRRLFDVYVPVDLDPEVVYAFGRISHIFYVKVNLNPWFLKEFHTFAL